jgi:hypothetical protein
MANKLYLITPDYYDSWDTYDSAVVCARSKKHARSIHPDGSGKQVPTRDEYDYTGPWGDWCPLECVTVKYIGVAATFMETGVVCASYNARGLL